MKKLVYLFELDSVRKTDMEIEIGQEAIFNEIVCNGNTVVLTYNQLVDSRAFFSLLDDEEYYKEFIKLFKSGFIRVSQYGDVRTIVQYLLNTLSQEKSFIYSGWPLKSTQKRLLALIRRSLMYSDLSEINDYIHGKRSDDEIKDLFIEVNSDIPMETNLSLESCNNILENLFCLLKTVLRLSSIPAIYVNPKPILASEHDCPDMSFPEYLSRAMRLTPPSVESDIINRLWGEAIAVLSKVREKIKVGSLDRSNYHHVIKELYSEGSQSESRTKAFQFAEAIVDLCYNYQLEYSICNSSKHYNPSEFKSDDPLDWKSFTSDFFLRLKETWDIGHREERYLLEETNEFHEYIDKEGLISAKLKQAVQLLGYIHKRETGSEDNSVRRYEYLFENQQSQRFKEMLSSINKKGFYALVCFIIALGIEVVYEYFQNYLDLLMSTWIHLNSPLWVLFRCALGILIVLGVTEYITSIIQRRFKDFLSLSDVLKEIGHIFHDQRIIDNLQKATTHFHFNPQNVCKTESRQSGMTIKYLISPAIKKYLKLQKEQTELFAQSEIYPIVDLNTDRDLSLTKLIRIEELFDYQFGVLYRSKYNTMIVDPIFAGNDLNPEYYPYERIIPSSGKGGTVMIPSRHGKFILIKQFRHATRSEQYCFPRGYGERIYTSVENAKREIEEELGTEVIGDPIALNKVSADSGLTSSLTDVFIVEIGEPEFRMSREGIIGYKELSEDEITDYIREGKIQDGFTLSSWTLYQAKCRSACPQV